MNGTQFPAGVPIAFALVLASGCTGMTLGENGPGGDTYLDDVNPPMCRAGDPCGATGSIGVDPRDETAWVQVTTFATTEGGSPVPTAKHLYAVDPDDASVDEVADLSGHSDVRVLYPEGSVLVMAESNGTDRLLRFDPATHALLEERDTTARYHGTRMSPSRRFIAVADNLLDSAPIHLVEAATFDTAVMPHDGEWLEAMWLQGRDELLAIVFYDQLTPQAHARILAWRIEDLGPLGDLQPDPTGFWPNRILDIDVPGASGDFFFSFTWVGVAPDDRHVAFPVLTYGGTDAKGNELWDHDLLVLDVGAGALQTVPDAYGPVGFTPDGTTIVSYHYVDGTPALKIVDTETLAAKSLPIPWTGLPQFFVTREGNFVVVASTFGDEQLVLYDLDNDTSTTMKGPQIDLAELVSRVGHAELWLADDGLFRLDFASGLLAAVDPGFVPGHINILPSRDLLVLDDVARPRLAFYDPEALEVVRSTDLPIAP